MHNIVVHHSERIYELLLRFYPEQYRREFGEEMKYVFSESLKDAYRESGEGGLFTVWVRTLFDAGKSLCIQHVEHMKGRTHMKTKRNDILMDNNVFLWIALGTAGLLTIPFVGMQFSTDVDWSMSDFVIMGALIFGTGSIFVMLSRLSSQHRWVIGLTLLVAFLYIWAELAVGIFINWGS